MYPYSSVAYWKGVRDSICTDTGIVKSAMRSRPRGNRASTSTKRLIASHQLILRQMLASHSPAGHETSTVAVGSAWDRKRVGYTIHRSAGPAAAALDKRRTAN